MTTPPDSPSAAQAGDDAPILIAGAGIGGLALAVALQREGIPFRVFERAATPRGTGWGLGLAPNGLLALRRVGLEEAAIAAGIIIERVEVRTARGRLLREFSLAAVTSAVGAPTVAIARGALHELLVGALRTARIEPGRDVSGIGDFADGESAEGPVLQFADGAAVRGRLIVGADGAGSVIRRAVLGDAPPRDAGYVAYRGLSPAGDALPPGCAMLTLGAGQRFGCAHVGGGQVYWFATLAGAPVAPEGEAGAAWLLERFARWHAPVRALMAATPADRILRTAVSDREPVGRWSRGCVTLLGDAAHPMTPDMGQGACQAIEDAVALADALAVIDDVPAVLRRYERSRVDRAAWMVRRSRQIGQIEQARNPLLVAVRDLAYAYAPEKAILGQLTMLAPRP